MYVCMHVCVRMYMMYVRSCSPGAALAGPLACMYVYVCICCMYAVAHLELLWLDLQPLQTLVLFLRAVAAAAAEGRRQRGDGVFFQW
jgi:hypothetical protein